VVSDDKIIAYSGDTEWTDALTELADGADLFVCEAYVFERSVKYHLSYATLSAQRSRLRCKRLVLTHMSADMLSRRGEVEAELAEDGLTVAI
jgi:ribonuclease BN (tRNA processing enzyme)